LDTQRQATRSIQWARTHFSDEVEDSTSVQPFPTEEYVPLERILDWNFGINRNKKTTSNRVNAFYWKRK
jgi:hypothetical protein